MIRTLILAFAAATLATSAAIAIPVIGQKAPAFTAIDSNGVKRSLAGYKGKIVVLEWTNNGCPYVRKHYGSGNMQKVQADITGQGVIWLSVISSAPGKQGYVDGAGNDTVDNSGKITSVLN